MAPNTQVQVLKLIKALVPGSVLPTTRGGWKKAQQVATGTILLPQKVSYCPSCERICPQCLPKVSELPRPAVPCEHHVCEQCGSDRKSFKGINVLPSMEAFLKAYQQMLVTPGEPPRASSSLSQHYVDAVVSSRTIANMVICA